MIGRAWLVPPITACLAVVLTAQQLAVVRCKAQAAHIRAPRAGERNYTVYVVNRRLFWDFYEADKRR